MLALSYGKRQQYNAIARGITTCEGAEALVEHVWRDHGGGRLRRMGTLGRGRILGFPVRGREMLDNGRLANA